jgi:hypothetical protein
MFFLMPKACLSTAKVRFDLFTATTLGAGLRIVHKILAALTRALPDSDV